MQYDLSIYFYLFYLLTAQHVIFDEFCALFLGEQIFEKVGASAENYR
jgi:hypothetical protein